MTDECLFVMACEYSKRPKTGRPVFGAFDLCPVCESSGFQTTSDNQTLSSGYRTSGQLTLHASNRTILNRTSEIRTILSGYRTIGTNRTSEIRKILSGFQTSGLKLSGFRTFGQLNRPEIRTMYYTSDVRNPDDSKSGHNCIRFAKPDVRFSDVYCIHFYAYFYLEEICLLFFNLAHCY